MNGQAIYFDRCEFPCPAIRFKEPTPEITQLQEKEKGDWKNLSLAEKKACKEITTHFFFFFINFFFFSQGPTLKY